MPLPASYDIDTYQGDTLGLALTLVDSASAAISLATATVKLQVRKHPGAPVKLELPEGDGITVGGAGNNVVTISKLITLLPGDYRYDLEATFSGGGVRTYVGGSFTVRPQITI